MATACVTFHSIAYVQWLKLASSAADEAFATRYDKAYLHLQHNVGLDAG